MHWARAGPIALKRSDSGAAQAIRCVLTPRARRWAQGAVVIRSQILVLGAGAIPRII